MRVGVDFAVMIRHRHLKSGPVAQGLEQSAHNRLVVGSIPTGPTKKSQLLDKKGFWIIIFVSSCYFAYGYLKRIYSGTLCFYFLTQSPYGRY